MLGKISRPKVKAAIKEEILAGVNFIFPKQESTAQIFSMELVLFVIWAAGFILTAMSSLFWPIFGRR